MLRNSVLKVAELRGGPPQSSFCSASSIHRKTAIAEENWYGEVYDIKLIFPDVDFDLFFPSPEAVAS